MESPSPAEAEPLTPEQFSKLLTPLRAELLKYARTRFTLSETDAEDLLEDTILTALQDLPSFSPHHLITPSSPHPLTRWLLRLMNRRRRADRERNARRPQTAPLYEARNETAPPDPSASQRVTINQRPLRHYLTRHHEQLVQAWLDGYTQEEIAGGFRISRNTVGIRLEHAFDVLRAVHGGPKVMPREDEIIITSGLINYCSKVAVYHKPPGSCARWMRRHPYDRRLLGTRPVGKGRRLGVGKTTLKVVKPA